LAIRKSRGLRDFESFSLMGLGFPETEIAATPVSKTEPYFPTAAPLARFR